MSSLVQVYGDEVSYAVNSPAEAKLAIKELKLLKKGFSLQKKERAEVIRGLKFNYSQEVRSRGSMVRGGGGFGRFLRGVQTVSRDGKRAGLARDLHSHEVEKARIEGMMQSIEHLVIKLEVYLHSSGQ